MSVIALDVGTRRIGVAVGEGTFAFPHSTIERTNVRDDVAAIVALARERGARTIVVGDPLTMSGERALASEKIDAFVAHLARAFDGAIERVDERLTTAAAQKSLIARRRVARQAQEGRRPARRGGDPRDVAGPQARGEAAPAARCSGSRSRSLAASA